MGDMTRLRWCSASWFRQRLTTAAFNRFAAFWRELRGKITEAPRVRLSVLGSFTTKQLVNFLDLYLFARQEPTWEIYEGEYGVFRQEIFESESKLHHFSPQIVFLATSWRDLAHRPALNSSSAEVRQALESEQADWSDLRRKVHRDLHCQVIQNNCRGCLRGDLLQTTKSRSARQPWQIHWFDEPVDGGFRALLRHYPRCRSSCCFLGAVELG